MLRENVTVVDCTIRDGGLMNDSQFDIETVRAVFDAVCKSGLDYCELGYRNSKKMFDPAQFGPWRFCEEEDMRAATEGIDHRNTKVAVMMDAHKSSPEDLLPKSESVIDMVRVATYVKDMPLAIRLANHAHELGYETAINIMAISHAYMGDLEKVLDEIETKTSIQAVNCVDSFGALYADQLHFLIEKFKMHMKTKAVGVHFHNNQQLAFANTIDAINRGCTWADATLNGFGRAAGNCCTELLVGFLKNPNHDILPLLEVLGKYIIPLKKSIEWGYHIPYLITGQLNQHPTTALRQMGLTEEEGKYDYVKFYSEVDE
jgi:4-hydroxy 2-oxovalerate aldolase